MRLVHFGCVGVIVASLAAGAAFAGPVDECSCNTLESLQQEYQNAIYTEKFFRDLSAALKDWETKEAAEKAKGWSSVDIVETSKAMLKVKSERDVRLPFPKVKGYTGPERVSMKGNTCEQPKAELDALRKGSPCFGIAEAVLKHEIGHQEICNKMGAAAYWDRMGSVLALEEADSYRAQAADMKAEIGRVLDRAEVRLEGEWTHTLTGEGAEIIFYYAFDSGDMLAMSDTDGLMSFKGVGTSSNEILSMKAEGISCVSTGAVTQKMEATLSTDGLEFGIDLVETNTGGDLVVKCDGGMSMAMPTGDAGSGQLAAGLPLKAGKTPVMNSWATTIKDLATSMGMNVSGEPVTTLNISCPKP
ncbi:hypothetical protein MCELHM10_03064 [Paracoccaceae bacterium]|jgi:hypothetical protein